MRKEFKVSQYLEANMDSFDELIATTFDIPGFEAQRVFEWQNDTYQVESILAQDEDERVELESFLSFLHESRTETIKAIQQRDLEFYKHVKSEEPEGWHVLDWQIEAYSTTERVPPLSAFLCELARRELIPWGDYLISISW